MKDRVSDFRDEMRVSFEAFQISHLHDIRTITALLWQIIIYSFFLSASFRPREFLQLV